MTPEGLAALKLMEGFRARAYPDPISNGKPYTVGYGSTGAGIGPDTVWTEAQADADLRKRVQQIEAQLQHAYAWFVTVPAVRQDALVNIAYNVGVAGLATFGTFVALMQEERWGAAALDLSGTLWSRQTKTRATAIESAIKSGVWS